MKKLTYDEVKTLFENNGFILRSKKYKNSSTKLWAICKENNHRLKITVSDVKLDQQNACLKCCRIKKIIPNKIQRRYWSKQVKERDLHTCQKCNKKKKPRTLHAHHIYNFSSHIELRYEISNGITFCSKCHKEFHKIFGNKNNTQEQINNYLQ